MDHSIHDVMDSLVAADAARMSGRDFADARGAGLARKVRTRRTVRAAGVGGASAVAVGALAFGAMHMPWASGVRTWQEQRRGGWQLRQRVVGLRTPTSCNTVTPTTWRTSGRSSTRPRATSSSRSRSTMLARRGS